MNRVCISAAALLAASMGAHAQGWPQKPVRIVIAYAAGGTTDLVARAFAPHYQKAWGQPVIIDNRPGAGGHLAAEHVAKSPGDGYTLLLTSTGGQAAGPALYRKLSYDPVKELVGVASLGWSSNIMVVNPAVPATSLSEFIALAKKTPGKLNYGSSGVGSGPQFGFEMLKAAASIDVVHVPYKGDAPLQAALVANEVQGAIVVPNSVLAQIRAGKLRPLASTGTARLSIFPDVPTMAESGYPAVQYAPAVGLFAPASTPREIVGRINAETVKAMQDAEMVKTNMPRWALEPEILSADAFHARYLNDVESFRRVVRDAKIPLID